MKYLIIFVSFFLLFITINNYIIIPFNQLKSKEQLDFRDAEDLLNQLSVLQLYSDFYLGNYPHKLPTLLKQNIDYFALTKNQEKELISSDNYSPSVSESLKILDKNKKIHLYNSKQQYIEVTEVIHFLTNEGDISLIYSNIDTGKIDANNYKSYLYINFYNSDSQLSDYEGILGLSFNNPNYPYNNFIKELQTKSVINSAIWSVDFPDIEEDTYTKGNIIIGEYPHIYDSQYYKKEDYYTYKIPVNHTQDNGWEIKLDSSSLLKNGEVGASCDYLKTISINFGTHMMYAPKSLFEQLKDLYFEDLFDDRICDYKKIKLDKEKIIFVYCDKKSFSPDEQRKFPKIIFNIQDLGGELELDYKDVFKTFDDKIYLMIAFSSKENDDNFILGQIFLYKYKFTFDYDNREIGFYLNDLKNAKIAHRIKRAFRGKTFFTILLLVVIVIFLCYYLRKKGYIGKKKIIDFNTANKNITHFTNENIEQGYELKTDI
jgi:hypothetical protein